MRCKHDGGYNFLILCNRIDQFMFSDCYATDRSVACSSSAAVVNISTHLNDFPSSLKSFTGIKTWFRPLQSANIELINLNKKLLFKLVIQ